MLREYYRDWSPLIRSIVESVPHTRVYPNVAASGIETWVLGEGRVTLAGDAAHAHGGAYAAGGSLAIDDAWAFAASILYVYPPDATVLPTRGEIARALGVYEGTRKAHTDRVLRVVHEGNRAKVERIGRSVSDEELRRRVGGSSGKEWIHEHDVQAAFRDAVARVASSHVEARL